MSLSLSRTNSPHRVGIVPGFLSVFLKLELRIRPEPWKATVKDYLTTQRRIIPKESKRGEL